MDWLRSFERGELSELDLEMYYSSTKIKGKDSDYGMPLEVLEYFTYYFQTDRLLEKLSLRCALPPNLLPPLPHPSVGATFLTRVLRFWAML